MDEAMDHTDPPAATGGESRQATSRSVRKNADVSRYEILVGGEVVGFADYRPLADGRVMMPHTVVHGRMQGQGLAAELVRFALDDIRADGAKVVPSCSYVRAYIADHPEQADLVA